MDDLLLFIFLSAVCALLVLRINKLGFDRLALEKKAQVRAVYNRSNNYAYRPQLAIGVVFIALYFVPLIDRVLLVEWLLICSILITAVHRLRILVKLKPRLGNPKVLHLFSLSAFFYVVSVSCVAIAAWLFYLQKFN